MIFKRTKYLEKLIAVKGLQGIDLSFTGLWVIQNVLKLYSIDCNSLFLIVICAHQWHMCPKETDPANIFPIFRLLTNQGEVCSN